MSTLHTAGQLRAMLAGTIVDLREGRIDKARAYTIAKLAAGINESLLAEVAVARLRAQHPESQALGQLLIHDQSAPLALRPPQKALRADQTPDPDQ